MSAPLIFCAALSTLEAAARTRLVNRQSWLSEEVRVDMPARLRSDVRAIIEDVRDRGDAALRDMALRFDGVSLDCIAVPRTEWDAALARLDAGVCDALEEAAAAISVFHRNQVPPDMEVEVRPGVRIGRRAEPLASVGVYAPGGRAAYPSSVLMGVIPARIAGVGEIVVCSPAGPGGTPPDLVLAACAIAGADVLYAVGGAGAVAALAYGTQSIRRVARIIGPGNAYVAEAKQQVSSVVGIDSPAGPSEVLVIADAFADPRLIAVELLAQAEHDPDAAAVAVFVAAPSLRPLVYAALDEMARDQPRAEIIQQALSARGALLDAASLDEALAFATEYAPEHLSLMVSHPRAVLPRVRCAGTIFLGSSSSVAFGDYMTGANHVLPTGGMARSFSGLGTADFLRFTTYQEVDERAAAALAGPVQVLAGAEGLPAHGLAARMRAGCADRSMCASEAARRCNDSDSPADGRRPALRSQLLSVERYDPGRTPCEIDLSDNTNLFGVPPAARAILDCQPAGLITRYPTVYGDALKRAAAGRHSASADNIATGCGSDDLLDAIFRAFCDPGATVAFPSPTFGVIDMFARLNGARPLAIPSADGTAVDVEQLLRARAGVTYICRPNNPTGTLTPRAVVERLAADVTGVLVIDEAYADYASDDLIDLALTSPRVIVVRTLSKAFGLAGLRVGYAVGCAPLIREVEKARGPYKLGATSEAAAVAALSMEDGWIAEHVSTVRENRSRLFAGLRDAGFDPLQSEANFLLVPVSPPATARLIARSLRRRGVAVRPFDNLHGIGDAIRVGIGPRSMMDRFISALSYVSAERGKDVA